jgi:hypothetical protein
MGYVSGSAVQSVYTEVYGAASGGTSITPWTVSSVNYNGSKFTVDGTLTVSRPGLFDLLMVGSGGGGAGGANGYEQGTGGGGSGGQVLPVTVYLTAGTYDVKIGTGQPGGRAPNFVGTGTLTSVQNIASALYGGMGGGYYVGPQSFGNGAGGGGSVSPGGITGSTGLFVGFSTTFTGGNGRTAANPGGAGGGGAGAGGNGGNFSGTTTGGAGGIGYNAINYNGGVALTVGSGGGGGTISGTAGTATGGGGAGGANANGTNGTANTGGGGGGGGSATTDRIGGNGGSGIVFARWKV